MKTTQGARLGGSVKFCFVGLDPILREQCEGILAEVAPGGWEAARGAFPKGQLKADLYVIEFKPEEYPQTLSPELAARSLFVVDPKHLGQFREWLGKKRASILLKPVLPASLRPFLECSFGKRSLREDATARKVAHSTDELDQLLDSLLHANLKLQEFDQYRTNFLARAIHDFRAPLTAISGYCGLLIEQRLGPLKPDQLDLLRRMQHSVGRVSRLSEAMFELSVKQRSNHEPDLQENDIEAAISQAIHEVTPRAEEKQIRITVGVERPLHPLRFDAGKIEQVLVNLLENACKFTPKHGTLDIEGYPVQWYGGAHSPAKRPGSVGKEGVGAMPGHAYRVDVRDSGSGVPHERLESIFEEYTSYGGGSDRSGGGLGLAICRMIVQAHGGRIWAESGPAGAQFSFILAGDGKEASGSVRAAVKRTLSA